MNRPDPSDDLRLEVAAGTLLLPVLLGVIAGVVLGLVSLFTVGRLTIGTLYPMGGTGVALNAALGGVAAAVIGVAASRLTTDRAAASDDLVRRARTRRHGGRVRLAAPDDDRERTSSRPVETPVRARRMPWRPRALVVTTVGR